MSTCLKGSDNRIIYYYDCIISSPDSTVCYIEKGSGDIDTAGSWFCMISNFVTIYEDSMGSHDGGVQDYKLLK